MKKLLFFLGLMFIPFTINYVNASSVSVSMSGTSTIDAGSNFDITVSMSGTDIWGATIDLSYDTDKLELVSSEGKDGFSATVGSRIVVDASNAHNGNFNIVVLRFKAKSNFTAGQTTTVSISNIEAGTSSELLTGNGTSKTITVNIPKSTDNKLSNLQINGTTINGFNADTTNYSYSTEESSINVSATANDSKAKVSGIGTKNLNYGSNNITITVTAENGSTRNYKINVTRKDNRSTNNYLSKLEIKEANIKFNKDTLNYSANVENNVSSIEIVATASDSKAKVSGTGKKQLNVYANSFTVSVTAENGSVRNYVIKINRKDEAGNLGELSKNNKLKELNVEGYDINFNKDTNNYQLEVDNIVDFVNVKALVEDDKSTMEIDNPDKLVVGINQIKIKVVAENGDENTYVITVTRKDDVPIATIDEITTILDKITTSKIEIEIKDNNDVINKDLTSKLKEKEVEVIIKKYNDNNLIYYWNLNSKNFKKDFELNSAISFDTDKKSTIDKLTNYSDSFYLNFSHSGTLPKDTTITIYVGSKYIDGDKINLYYYNEQDNKIEMVNQELVVENGGYVTIELEHCSNYLLSKAIIGEQLKNDSINFTTIIAILEGVIILLLLLFIAYKTGFFDRFKKSKAVIEQENKIDNNSFENINIQENNINSTSDNNIENITSNIDNNLNNTNISTNIDNSIDNNNNVNNNIFDNNNINNDNAINSNNNIFK